MAEDAPRRWIPPTEAQSLCWTGFEMSEDITPGSHRRAARCTYCKQIFQGKIERLAKHMEHQCKHIPPEARAEYCTLVLRSDKGATLSTGNASSSKSTESKRSLKRAREAFVHLQKPSKRRVRSTTAEQAALLHSVLLKACITAQTSFEFLDNPYFQEFQRQLAQSEYQLPARASFEESTLPLLHAENQNRVSGALNNQTSLTISLGGWTDGSENSIYSLFALKGTTIREFLQFLEIHCNRNNTVHVFAEVANALKLKSIGWQAVTAVVSNSPSVMTAFRVSNTCPHVISIHCILHSFKLIAKQIMKHPLLETVVQTNRALCHFFTASPFWTEELSGWRQKEGIKLGLQTIHDTRWFSLAKICICVAEHEPGFRKCLSMCLDPKLNTPEIDLSTRLAIDDREHFTANSALVSLLRRVLDALTKLERPHTTVSSVWKELLSVYSHIQNLNETYPSHKRLQDYALKLIDARSHIYDQEIYIIGLFLHPQYRRTATSRKYSLDDLNWKIIDLAHRWQYSLADAKSVAVDVLRYYSGESIYKDNLSVSYPIDYWYNLPVTTEASPLKRLAIRVLEIVPYATGVQSLSDFQSNTTSQMDPSSSKMVSEIRMHLLSEAQTVAARSQAQFSSTSEAIECNADRDWEEETFDVQDEPDAFGDVALIDSHHRDQSLLNTHPGFIESLFDLNVFHQDNVLVDRNHSSQVLHNGDDVKGWSIKDVFLS